VALGVVTAALDAPVISSLEVIIWFRTNLAPVNLGHPDGILRFSFPSLSKSQAAVALVKVGVLAPLVGTIVVFNGKYKLDVANILPLPPDPPPEVPYGTPIPNPLISILPT
jgi:hypothetical protein